MIITDSTARPRYATDATAVGFRHFVATRMELPKVATRAAAAVTPPSGPAASFRQFAATHDRRAAGLPADFEALYPALFAAPARKPSIGARVATVLGAARIALRALQMRYAARVTTNAEAAPVAIRHAPTARRRS